MIEFEPHDGDALIDQIGALFDKIRASEFPRLIVEEVTDDGQTYKALRCPRCGDLVESEELYAVDFSERWNRAAGVEDDHIREQIRFSGADDHHGPTVYYRHDNHAVRLPEFWSERWE